MWLTLINLLRMHCRPQNLGTKAWLLLFSWKTFIGMFTCFAVLTYEHISWLSSFSKAFNFINSYVLFFFLLLDRLI